MKLKKTHNTLCQSDTGSRWPWPTGSEAFHSESVQNVRGPEEALGAHGQIQGGGAGASKNFCLNRYLMLIVWNNQESVERPFVSWSFMCVN